MQNRALVLLSLLAAPVAAVTANTAALSWLQAHKSPTDDQLKELAGANPEAFAIVNALLTKHAHGKAALSAEERGPDVFRKMMGTPHLAAAAPPTAVAMPYDTETVSEASYRAPVVDNEHYDANSRSKRDADSVSKLLAAVAGMGGNKGKKIAALMKKKHIATQEENALDADANMFDEEQAPRPSPVEMAEAAVAQPQPQQVVTPAPRKVNSWLKGLDLSGDMPIHVGSQMQANSQVQSNVDDTSADSLPNSFQAAAMQEIEKPKPQPVVVEAPKPKKPNNVFLKWLSAGESKAAVPEEAPAAPVKKTNSYLDSVKFFG